MITGVVNANVSFNPALEKLQRKKLDAIAANPVDLPDVGFAGDRNQAIFLDSQGRQQQIEPCTKLQLVQANISLEKDQLSIG